MADPFYPRSYLSQKGTLAHFANTSVIAQVLNSPVVRMKQAAQTLGDALDSPSMRAMREVAGSAQRRAQQLDELIAPSLRQAQTIHDLVAPSLQLHGRFLATIQAQSGVIQAASSSHLARLHESMDAFASVRNHITKALTVHEAFAHSSAISEAIESTQRALRSLVRDLEAAPYDTDTESSSECAAADTEEALKLIGEFLRILRAIKDLTDKRALFNALLFHLALMCLGGVKDISYELLNGVFSRAGEQVISTPPKSREIHSAHWRIGIADHSARVYSRPTTKSPSGRLVIEGDVCVILEKRRRFYKVIVLDETGRELLSGYVATKYIKAQ